MADINLWLDAYDDIYSDFDSRHFRNRRISEDFLAELQIEMKDQSQNPCNIILFLPQEQRNVTTENVIINSLKDFFTRQCLFHGKKCNKKLKKGLIFFAIGVVVLWINSWIIYRAAESFSMVGLRVLLEPGGWFLLWAGFDFLVYDYPELKREKHFYKALRKMGIQFQSS